MYSRQSRVLFTDRPFIYQCGGRTIQDFLRLVVAFLLKCRKCSCNHCSVLRFAKEASLHGGCRAFCNIILTYVSYLCNSFLPRTVTKFPHRFWRLFITAVRYGDISVNAPILSPCTGITLFGLSVYFTRKKH